MKSGILAATVLALATVGGVAHSAEQPNGSGFYIGGGVGQFNVKIDAVNDTDDAVKRLDDDDTSWKAFAGYRFNPYLSLELAYIDFGNPNGHTNVSGSDGNYDIKLDGFAPYVIGTFPLGPVELFGKVGYYFYNVDVTTDFDNRKVDSSSSEDLLYGFGVGITLFEHLNARLEYEKIDADDIDDADAIWVSGAWRF